jgi:hypothetical protein
MKAMPNSFTIKEILASQWWFALIGSMSQSKTLTAMVILGCISFGSLMLFLFNIVSA